MFNVFRDVVGDAVDVICNMSAYYNPHASCMVGFTFQAVMKLYVVISCVS